MKQVVRGFRHGIACLAAGLCATAASAAVTISSQSTQSMNCSNGVCTPTAKNAILNVGDLENLLASGNLTVTTTGAGVEANDINLKSPLSWASANTLSFTAHRSIAIDAPVSVVGQSGLSLQTGGSKGLLTFGRKGSVGFSSLSSQLAINGVSYTLVGNVKTLSVDIAASPSGAYALAGLYDASADGTYGKSPIETVFTGSLEGLGNTILNLSVSGGTNTNGHDVEGLFTEIDAKGAVRDIGLVNATFVVPKSITAIGGTLVGINSGSVLNCYATGIVTAEVGSKFGPEIGGLIGSNSGLVDRSYTNATVGTRGRGGAGGLVGDNEGAINQSYATGAVRGSSAGGLVELDGGAITESFATGSVLVIDGGEGGGLVSRSAGGLITNTYAMGAVSGPKSLAIGGLVGGNSAPIRSSYSTGAMKGTGLYVGGLIGYDGSNSGSLTDTDWDTDTSGITNLSQGAGNIANDPGITGLSTAQFQSGLPPGFDPKIWAEKPNINGGLPYLLANPPPK